MRLQQRPLGQQRPETAEKKGQKQVPRQISMVLQRVPVENPFFYRSVAVGGFLEDRTSLCGRGGEAIVKKIVLFFRLCNDNFLFHTRYNLLGGFYPFIGAIDYCRLANKVPNKDNLLPIQAM